MNYVVKDNKYIRYNYDSKTILSDKIKEIYNHNVLITSSGLHANSYILEILKIYYSQNKINILYNKELYFENINLIKYFSKINNINSYEFDLFDDNNLKSILKNNYDQINILFIESCTNPFGYIFNYNIINELKEICPKLIIVCDNTWLSNIIFNPFNVNIDIVTVSLTKYYSGNAAICGACIIKDIDIFNCADEYSKIYGFHISPININYINNSLNTYESRMIKLSILTKYTINYLLSENKEIIHPYLNNHISYNLVNEYFDINIYPSTFLIGTIITKEELSNNKLSSVSFGSNITKIDKNLFTDINTQKNYIRISIGYEETFESLKIKINDLIKYLI